MHEISLRVNGIRRVAHCEARTTLADVLREHLGLTGTHLGCEHGACGACTVLLDGDAVRACLVLGVQANDHDITTIEGIGPDDGHALGAIQTAFSQHHGLQCGFCTPGFVISLTDYLARHPDASPEELRVALSGNLCRCTGYQGIVDAALAAQRELTGAQGRSEDGP